MSARTRFMLVTLVVLSTLLAACSAPAATTAPAAATKAPAAATSAPAAAATTSTAAKGEPYKFGMLQPLTGPVADSGLYVSTGAKLAVQKINAEGGVCGRPLEIVLLDHKNDPQEAANVAELVITRDRVPIILGSYGSSPTLAVMPVLERHGIPMVVETASTPKVTDPATPGYKWVHRISPPSQLEADAAEPYLVSELKMKNVAFLSVNNDFGRGGAAAFKAAITKNGGTVVSDAYVEQAATDYLPQLTAIKNSNADSLIITSTANQIATILKQFKELGLKQLVLTNGGSNYPPQIIKLSSQSVVEGTWHVMFFIPDRLDLTGDPELAKWYVTEYGKQGLAIEGLGESYRGFDAAYVIAKAVQATNCSTDPTKLNDAVGKVEHKGLYGNLKFNKADGHQATPNIFLVKIEAGGKITVPDFQFKK